MAVAKLTQEQMEKISMIELASTILAEAKTEMSFIDLFNKVAELKSYTKAQKEDLLARFYTDLNVDGRFMAMGGNVWALKRWYPADQTAEKTLAESRKRRLEEDEALEDDEEYDEYADEAAYEKVYDEETELQTENEDDVEEDEFEKLDRVGDIDSFDD